LGGVVKGGRALKDTKDCKDIKDCKDKKADDLSAAFVSLIVPGFLVVLPLRIAVDVLLQHARKLAGLGDQAGSSSRTSAVPEGASFQNREKSESQSG
jgi:hypothetical protein